MTEDVVDFFSGLKTNKAWGPGNVPFKVLKLCTYSHELFIFVKLLTFQFQTTAESLYTNCKEAFQNNTNS